MRCRKQDVLKLLKPLGDVVDLPRAWEDEAWREWLETVFWVACAATYDFRVTKGLDAEDLGSVYGVVRRAREMHGGDVPSLERIPTIGDLKTLRGMGEMGFLEGNIEEHARWGAEELDVGDIGNGMATFKASGA